MESTTQVEVEQPDGDSDSDGCGADFDRAIELDPAEDEFAAARTEVGQLTGGSDTDDAVPGNGGTEAT